MESEQRLKLRREAAVARRRLAQTRQDVEAVDRLVDQSRERLLESHDLLRRVSRRLEGGGF